MDKKNKTPAEVETVTVTMSRPVAEAVQTACEMYLRLHMGQFNDLAEDLCMGRGRFTVRPLLRCPAVVIQAPPVRRLGLLQKVFCSLRRFCSDRWSSCRRATAGSCTARAASSSGGKTLVQSAFRFRLSCSVSPFAALNFPGGVPGVLVEPDFSRSFLPRQGPVCRSPCPPLRGTRGRKFAPKNA